MYLFSISKSFSSHNFELDILSIYIDIQIIGHQTIIIVFYKICISTILSN